MTIVFIFVSIYNYFTKFRYFKVLEATTHRFIEEAHHAKSFLNCRIKLMMKRSEKQLIFDELWIEDRLYKIKITNSENQLVENGFSHKQVLYIDVESEINYPEYQTFPAENLSSKIFLGYQVGNKRKYFPVVRSFTDLQRLSVA